MATHPHTDNPELDDALERLFSLQTFGIKLGTGPITALLEEFGNPHRQFPALHVAGTNGKGSVCAMLASVLQERGLRVGLYSSPHLVRFNERIRVNGQPIGDDRLALYTREMLPAIERHECTFFEGTTAMGFRYFTEEACDIAVIETGLGGRLDATNVLEPIACAITSIGFDHMKHLGDTLEKIAYEKGGIIKPQTPVVVGRVAPMLREVFEEKGRVESATVRFVDDFCRALYHDVDFTATTASFMIDGSEISRLRIGLVGRHQVENARVALGVIEEIRERFALDEATLRRGFERIRENTGIRGRFESVNSAPHVVIDVAHNPDGARVLVDTLSSLRLGQRKIRFVFGAVQDKEVSEIMKVFRPMAVRLYAVRAESDRSLPAEEIAHRSEQTGIRTILAGSVEAGITMAMNDAEENDVVVICGSFYVVGEAIELMESRNKFPGGIVFEPASRNRQEQTGSSTVSDRQTPEGNDGASTSRVVPETASVLASRSSELKRMSVKEWNESEQPRERLMSLGAESLSDAELLAILLRTGTKAEDVVQVSRNLLMHFESLADLARRDYRELQQIAGIGPTKAVTLAAAFEIARRVKAKPFAGKPKIQSPEDVANIYIPELRHAQKEQFHVLILNTANQVIRRQLVSEGNLNSSIVHPREVYRIAIIESAAAIIGLHNHPSGNPTPSREDIAITKQLVEAGRVIGIPFHDHIIIAGEEFVSLAQKGYV
jgi:dihydrofolate synthase/folylpolyglutamate synthase